MTISVSDYIYLALEKKNAKFSHRMPFVGDLIFDYNGDFLGVCINHDKKGDMKSFTITYLGGDDDSEWKNSSNNNGMRKLWSDSRVYFSSSYLGLV